MKTTSILMGLAGIMATTLVAAEVQNYATTGTSDQTDEGDQCPLRTIRGTERKISAKRERCLGLGICIS